MDVRDSEYYSKSNVNLKSNLLWSYRQHVISRKHDVSANYKHNYIRVIKQVYVGVSWYLIGAYKFKCISLALKNTCKWCKNRIEIRKIED